MMDRLEDLWVHYNDAIEDIETYRDKSDIYRIYEADKVDKKITQQCKQIKILKKELNDQIRHWSLANEPLNRYDDSKHTERFMVMFDPIGNIRKTLEQAEKIENG